MSDSCTDALLEPPMFCRTRDPSPESLTSSYSLFSAACACVTLALVDKIDSRVPGSSIITSSFLHFPFLISSFLVLPLPK